MAELSQLYPEPVGEEQSAVSKKAQAVQTRPWGPLEESLGVRGDS